jgi:hypothetical protein
MDTPTEPQNSPTPPTPPVPKPKGAWGMILTATPIALTALATAFAGLSSSEMTQAMYHRSLAAQHQSRAGDQWAFFQAKRIRGNGLEASGELLQALGHPEPFDPRKVDAGLVKMIDALQKQVATEWNDEISGPIERIKQSRQQFAALQPDASSYLTAQRLPSIDPRTLADPEARQNYEDVVAAIARRSPESETTALVARLYPETIDEAIRLAEEDADRFDRACVVVNDTVQQLKAIFKGVGMAIQPFRNSNIPNPELVSTFDRLDASFRAAVMDCEARRYRQEATFNRRAAEAYEVRVRRSGVESDRHRERSKRFFYSMLLAQVGVTVSSLALARAQRSLLWLLAAAVGLVAVCFTAYVYLSY